MCTLMHKLTHAHTEGFTVYSMRTVYGLVILVHTQFLVLYCIPILSSLPFTHLYLPLLFSTTVFFCLLSLITTNESQASNMFTSNRALGQSNISSSQFTQRKLHSSAMLFAFPSPLLNSIGNLRVKQDQDIK